MKTVQRTISQVMIRHGFRHKYEVAKYFGVTPQAVSTWLTKGIIPSKHLLKVLSESEYSDLPDAIQPNEEQSKTVIDYLINENIRLKNKIVKLKSTNIGAAENSNDLFERLNSKSLMLEGRLSDGVITDAAGDWYNAMGYHKSDLINRAYSDGFIHKDDSVKIKQNQLNILKSTGIKESRFSTVRRWKHKNTGHYIMLSMVWYIDVDNNKVEIIAKPIDSTFDSTQLKN